LFYQGCLPDFVVGASSSVVVERRSKEKRDTDMRPDYCRAKEPDPCKDCGATVEGKDSVRGICQARFSGPPPEERNYGLRIILVDRDTGVQI